MENFVILKRLMEKAQENKVSFHIPGHKNGKIYHQYEQLRIHKYFSPDMIALDVTEMPGTDNLHAPNDVIQEAQERAEMLRCRCYFFLSMELLQEIFLR